MPIDWSLIGYLSRPLGTQLTDIFLGGLTLDRKRITRAASRLSNAGEETTPIDQKIRAARVKVKNGQLPGSTWIAELFDDLLDTGVRFSADLLLFRKSLFTISGVVSEIAPRFSVDKTFFVSFFKYLSLDSPNDYTLSRFLATTEHIFPTTTSCVCTFSCRWYLHGIFQGPMPQNHGSLSGVLHFSRLSQNFLLTNRRLCVVVSALEEEVREESSNSRGLRPSISISPLFGGLDAA